jgi:hypothetical protein
MTAPIFSQLELHVSHLPPAGYSLALRYRAPKSDGDQRSPVAYSTALDGNALLQWLLNPAKYGESLTRQVFADPDAKRWFAQAWASAQTLNAPLRLQVVISPKNPELHAIRWERLAHPETLRPLTTGETVWFSRYPASQDWRPVTLRPKGQLRALAAVANPSGLSKDFAPVDVLGELQRARQGLGAIPLQALPDLMAGERATLINIVARLREDTAIFYLACHGVLKQGKPLLLLEDDQGQAALTSGDELATRLGELALPPRLVVLASCQSVGEQAENALLAVGPRLAEAGIPAVLAMQGSVAMATVADFMPVFFRELERDGQIDRAVAVARGTFRDQRDAWMPVLFLRSESGRLWADEPAEQAGKVPGAQIINTGSGAVATSGGVAAGQGGVAIGGDVHGNITIGTPPQKKD